MKEPGWIDGEVFFYDLIRKVEDRIIFQVVPCTEQQPSSRCQHTVSLREGLLLIRYEHEPELKYDQIE